MKSNKNLKMITNRFSVDQSKHLGKGCFGSVYEGFDHQTGKVIAIKHLNKPQNFKGEVETLQKLSTLTHPNIMGFYGYKADKDDVYLFVEYCPGGVLTDLIKKGLDEEQVLNLFRQLVEGMCYMNAKQIMHRDLKPDNILIGTNQDIKISDFGLARMQDGLQKTGQMGTPLYAGPQIYTNFQDAYNLNCDVWSAGLILHEMLTGKHPLEKVTTIYDLKEQWKMYEKGEKRIVYPKTMHPQWEYITNIMLTYNFKKRPMFHDILELLKKLDDNGSMRKQIRNAKIGIIEDENSKQVILENYLSFIQQKTDILLMPIQRLTQQKYVHIRDSLQNLLIFLGVTWYVIKLKNLIRNLKFKNLKYPNKQQVIERNNPDEQANLIMDKYRNVFEAKLTKYQNYLKQKVITRISEDEQKPEQVKTLKSAESAYKLYCQAKQGKYDVQATYEQQYAKLLSFHKLKPTQQKLASMTKEQLITYATILLVGFVNTQFSDENYLTKNYVNIKKNTILSFNQPNLLAFINKTRSNLK